MLNMIKQDGGSADIVVSHTSFIHNKNSAL